jgi:SAM-dependent methyltransferase
MAVRVANTLARLEVVEAERDRWQRPEAVLRAMGTREGMSVADLGAGAGYFALKLSAAVGGGGRVLAVDLRRAPLLFLRARAWRDGRHNIETSIGEAADPRLPPALDGVLIANTYHELTAPVNFLARVRATLRPGARVVVVDPHPGGVEGAPETPAHHHEPPESAVDALRRAGLDVVSRQDHFIDEAGHRWWLVVASR